MLKYQRQLTQVPIVHVSRRRIKGLRQPRQRDGKCPSPTSGRRSTQSLYAPQTPGCTDDELELTQPHATRFGTTFHSGRSTKSEITMYIWTQTD